MKAFLSTYKGIIYIVVTIVIILVAVYLWGKSRKNDELRTALPNETDWGKPLSEMESRQVAQVAAQLFADMDGVKLMGRDEAPYKTMTSMSDKLLVAVANHFQDRYCQDGSTIIVWLKSEQYYWYSYNLQNTVDNLIDRLYSLGVR